MFAGILRIVGYLSDDLLSSLYVDRYDVHPDSWKSAGALPAELGLSTP